MWFRIHHDIVEILPGHGHQLVRASSKAGWAELPWGGERTVRWRLGKER